MTLEEKLEKFIRLLKESRFAERLKESDDKWETFDDEKEKIEGELKVFSEEAYEQILKGDSILEDYKVTPENALEIVLVCVMTGIDDDDMLAEWEVLPKALRQIKGDLHEIAENIADFLEETEEERKEKMPRYFSEYEYGEEFIEEFF